MSDEYAGFGKEGLISYWAGNAIQADLLLRTAGIDHQEIAGRDFDNLSHTGMTRRRREKKQDQGERKYFEVGSHSTNPVLWEIRSALPDRYSSANSIPCPAAYKSSGRIANMSEIIKLRF